MVRTDRLGSGLGLLLGAGVGVGCTVPTEGFVDPREALIIDWVFDHRELADLELVGGRWVDDETPAHIDFDGAQEGGLGPDGQQWVPTLEALTIEAHIRIDAQGEDWTPRSIVGLPQTSSDGSYPLGLHVYTAAHRLELGMSAADMHVQVNRDQAYVPGEWLTVHGVYDGAQAWLYVDGEPIAGPYSVSGPLEGNEFDQSRQPIAVAGSGSSDAQLACGLASLRIYGRAMVPDEVSHRHRQLVGEGAP